MLAYAALVALAPSAYLKGLAADTWRCLADLVAPESGLPYDDSTQGEFTSVSNIGIALTATVAAREMGLIAEPEQDRRIDRLLDGLERFKTTFGFQQSWNSVATLAPASHDPWVSILDSGNLAAGLITVANARPKHARRCRRLFEAMEWGRFVSEDRLTLFGGLNATTGKINPDWKLSALGTDALLAQFLAIATGAASPELWGKLERRTETRDGHTYLWPGWEGGGLFMQRISGLWLDNSGTEIGRSSREFALAQVARAKAIGSPVWGWSASAAPDGAYLGWGGLKEDVVTPHAGALVLDDLPAEVEANLKALEKLGVRSPDRGFYDSVDWRTGKVARKFLYLDQGMLFLSLANHLTGGVVRKWFQADPVVLRGREAIPEYRKGQKR